MDGMATHKRKLRHAATGTESRNYPWPLLLIAAPAAVAVWSGWVGLGSMCGFGVIHPLPGILDSARINTAITLPVGVESYGAYALYVWLAGNGSAAARTFAKRSAIGALVLGCLGQVAFHLLAAAHWTVAPWPVVMLVACLPVVTLSFAAALVHLTRAGISATEEAMPEAAEKATAEAAAEATGEAITEAMPGAVLVPSEEPSEEPQMRPSEEPASVPREKPAREPRPRVVRLAEDPEAKRARAEYRKSVNQGQPLSDRALGARFGKSRTWGANRIAEVESGPALTAQAQ